MTLEERFRDLSDRAPAPVFLITWGRSGSNLLQSFLDGHPEILQIPTILALHVDWEIHLERLRRRPVDLLDAFFASSSFARDWYQDGLGDARDQSWNLDRPALRARLDRLLGDVAEVSKRDLLYGLHAAWADLHDMDTGLVRCLFVHHHLIPSRYASLTARNPIEFDVGEDGEEFRALEREFPGCRFVCSVRHPLEVFASIQRTMENESIPVDPSRSLLQWWSLLSIPGLLGREAAAAGARWRFVRFEELHVSTESVLRDLCGWLGCGWDDRLLESTFQGLAWWGNNPLRPMRGANPAMAKESWTNLPGGFADAGVEHLSDACGLLGYATPPPRPPSDALELQDLEAWLHARYQDPEDPSRLYALDASQREGFLREFWGIRERVWGPPGIAGTAEPGLLPESVEPFHPVLPPLERPGEGILHWDLGAGADGGGRHPAASEASTTWSAKEPRPPNPYHYWAGWRDRFAPFAKVLVSGSPTRHQRELLLGAASLGIRVEIHGTRGAEILPGTGCCWTDRLREIREPTAPTGDTLRTERTHEF